MPVMRPSNSYWSCDDASSPHQAAVMGDFAYEFVVPWEILSNIYAEV